MELVRARTDIPVPRVFGFELDDANPVRAAFILMDFLPGSSAMDAEGGYDAHRGEIPPRRKAFFLEQIAKIQVQLSSIRLPKIGSIIRRDDNSFDVGPLPKLGGPFSTATEFFNAWAKHAKFPLSDDDIKKLVNGGPIDSILSSINAFPDRLREVACRVSANNSGPFPLYHPDFYHSNVIVDESFKVLGVIDWEGACTVPWELVEPPLFLGIVPPAMDDPKNYEADGQPKDCNIRRRLSERAEYAEYVQKKEEEFNGDRKLSQILLNPDAQGLAHAIKCLELNMAESQLVHHLVLRSPNQPNKKRKISQILLQENSTGAKRVLEISVEPSHHKQQGIRKICRAASRNTPITASDTIRELIEKWRCNKDIFRCEESSILKPIKRTSQVCGPLALWFSILNEGSLSRVHRRFYCLLLFRLSDTCERWGLSGDGALVLTELILLTGLIHLDKTAILARLRGWIAGGKRYQLLSEDLGGPGILFLLPEEIGEQIWLHRLPNGKGKKRGDVILSLKNREISSLATKLQAHAAARNFLDLHTELFYDMVSVVYHVVLFKPENHAVSKNSPTPENSMVSDQKLAGLGRTSYRCTGTPRLYAPHSIGLFDGLGEKSCESQLIHDGIKGSFTFFDCTYSASMNSEPPPTMDFGTGSSFQLEASQSIRTSSQAPFLASSAQSEQLRQPVFGSVCDTPCYKGVERLVEQRKDAEILQMHISATDAHSDKSGMSPKMIGMEHHYSEQQQPGNDRSSATLRSMTQQGPTYNDINHALQALSPDIHLHLDDTAMALQDVDQRRALNLNDTAIALHGIAPDSNVHEHNATMALEGYSQ
ncbi:hypothetical protein KXV80_003701, partial [Aspergillus fumigatus]